MIQQEKSKIVQYWANNHLVVSGNHCQLIIKNNQKNIFELNTAFFFCACNKNYQFIFFEGIA